MRSPLHSGHLFHEPMVSASERFHYNNSYPHSISLRYCNLQERLSIYWSYSKVSDKVQKRHTLCSLTDMDLTLLARPLVSQTKIFYSYLGISWCCEKTSKKDYPFGTQHVHKKQARQSIPSRQSAIEIRITLCQLIFKNTAQLFNVSAAMIFMRHPHQNSHIFCTILNKRKPFA